MCRWKYFARKAVIDTHRYTAPQAYPAEGAFAGSDLSGEVVRLGPNLQSDIKIGDVVGASVVGSTFPVHFGGFLPKGTDYRQLRRWFIDVTSGRGAFAEYAKAFSDLVWKVPDGTYSPEEVAATGVP